MSKLRMLSLCSGIGGAELGAEMTGEIEVVGQVENEPFCQAVLAKHWPHVPRMTDIHDVQGDEFGEVDIIVAGVPCQGNSLAGKRKGSQDQRNLWPETKRIIGTTQPRWVVVENVVGLLSVDAGQLFATLLADLDTMGYRVGWCVYGAGEIGAPHKRERIFLVAYSSSARRTFEWNGISTRTNDTTCSSSDVAHPSSIGQRTWGTELQGQQWEIQPHGSSTPCSEVAHPCSNRCWNGTHQQERGTECTGTPNTCVHGNLQPVAHATSEGLQKWRCSEFTTSETQARTGMDTKSERCGEVAHPNCQRCQELDITTSGSESRLAAGCIDTTVAHPDSNRRSLPSPGQYSTEQIFECSTQRTTQPCMGGSSHGLSSWLDGHRWPSGPGEEQEAWEPPRIITKKEKYRNKRLKALGNAIVPQQIYPLFQSIVDVEKKFIS